MLSPDTREKAIKLLFEQGPVQRFTQDSPVMPDVWMAYAEDPDQQLDLLVRPYQPPGHAGISPGELAQVLRARLQDSRKSRAEKFLRSTKEKPHGVAYNESEVAVRLYFDELVRVVLPLSSWWDQRVRRARLLPTLDHLDVQQEVDGLAGSLAQQRFSNSATWTAIPGRLEAGPEISWFVRVVGMILLFNNARRFGRAAEHERALQDAWQPATATELEDYRNYYRRLLTAIADVFRGRSFQDEANEDAKPAVYMVNLNRAASVSVWRSSVAVKADAARSLFTLKCDSIVWGIIDSGIDAKHPAFGSGDGKVPAKDAAKAGRVVRTFDFTAVRALLSSDSLDHGTLPARLRRTLALKPELAKRLREIAAHSAEGRDLDWKMLRPLIEIEHDDAHYEAPQFEHGTHVAGILGAHWKTGSDDGDVPECIKGMCPDIRMYDLRVLDDEGKGAEFNVLAALQFVRYLNSQKSNMVIHGVNISLSIPHQVINFACGRTPVCDECDRLVQSGVTVVVAAGNRGHVAARPPYVEETYRSISITDPGNGDRVITVGATHRDMPHTYGVSYFSSRGPTGDGRIKPDLVAPGEKIESCVPSDRYPRRMDGTSMAAPHVSGAAALLMARHNELIGQPERIKQILCDTATDLGRERYFQGHGMLDVLRALQKV